MARNVFPLRVDEEDVCDADGNVVVYGIYLPEILPPGLVVRAINAHDALVAALEKISNVSFPGWEAQTAVDYCRSTADAALALARGEG